jgi:hypothetical protein
MAGQLRKRKTKSNAISKEKKAEEGKTNDAVEVTREPGEETLWETFVSHPLIKVLPFFLIPYCLFHAYFFVVLQYPELFGGLVRPAVGLTGERQLLIVGTISSGTVQVTSSLYRQFQLEVVHEAADTRWYFARDGTVSSFHGIRFLPRQAPQVMATLCLNYTEKMGFHPTMYRSNSGCSSFSKWDNCWARECLLLLDQEWGCGLADQPYCETPYRKTLHQVRHPLRTVESLVSEFCVGGINGELNPSFFTFMSPMIQSLSEEDSCIEAVVKYVLEYTTAMIDARKKGFIAGMYQIETASPCDIVQLAGLTNPQDVVYEPNYEKISNICSLPFHDAKSPVELTSSDVGPGQISLEWNDLQGGMHRSNRTDDMLADALKALTIELGYDLNPPKDSTESEF